MVCTHICLNDVLEIYVGYIACKKCAVIGSVYNLLSNRFVVYAVFLTVADIYPLTRGSAENSRAVSRQSLAVAKHTRVAAAEGVSRTIGAYYYCTVAACRYAYDSVSLCSVPAVVKLLDKARTGKACLVAGIAVNAVYTRRTVAELTIAV